MKDGKKIEKKERKTAAALVLLSFLFSCRTSEEDGDITSARKREEVKVSKRSGENYCAFC